MNLETALRAWSQIRTECEDAAQRLENARRIVFDMDAKSDSGKARHFLVGGKLFIVNGERGSGRIAEIVLDALDTPVVPQVPVDGRELVWCDACEMIKPCLCAYRTENTR